MSRPYAIPLDQIETIIQRIEDGDTQAEIAEYYGVAPSSVTRLLQSSPEVAERSARARAMSAESWLDRGLKALTDAPADSNEIARARAIAQECARRAAIRNPQYSEKQRHEVTGAGGGAVVVEIVRFTDPAP